MNRILRRIVAVLLVSCLLAETVPAGSALAAPVRLYALTSHEQISCQALAQSSWTSRPIEWLKAAGTLARNRKVPLVAGTAVLSVTLTNAARQIFAVAGQTTAEALPRAAAATPPEIIQLGIFGLASFIVGVAVLLWIGSRQLPPFGEQLRLRLKNGKVDVDPDTELSQAEVEICRSIERMTHLERRIPSDFYWTDAKPGQAYEYSRTLFGRKKTGLDQRTLEKLAAILNDPDETWERQEAARWWVDLIVHHAVLADKKLTWFLLALHLAPANGLFGGGAWWLSTIAQARGWESIDTILFNLTAFAVIGSLLWLIKRSKQDVKNEAEMILHDVEAGESILLHDLKVATEAEKIGAELGDRQTEYFSALKQLVLHRKRRNTDAFNHDLENLLKEADGALYAGARTQPAPFDKPAAAAPVAPSKLPIDSWGVWMARFVAGALLVMTLPLTVPIAIMVKLSSPGPAIFQHTRRGYRGREFQMLKFRWMTNEKQEEDRKILWYSNFLRGSKLDELPQLVNILRGDMQWFGPRPKLPGKEKPDYRPGVFSEAVNDPRNLCRKPFEYEPDSVYNASDRADLMRYSPIFNTGLIIRTIVAIPRNFRAFWRAQKDHAPAAALPIDKRIASQLSESTIQSAQKASGHPGVLDAVISQILYYEQTGADLDAIAQELSQWMDSANRSERIQFVAHWRGRDEWKHEAIKGTHFYMFLTGTDGVTVVKRSPGGRIEVRTRTIVALPHEVASPDEPWVKDVLTWIREEVLGWNAACGKEIMDQVWVFGSRAEGHWLKDYDDTDLFIRLKDPSSLSPEQISILRDRWLERLARHHFISDNAGLIPGFDAVLYTSPVEDSGFLDDPRTQFYIPHRSQIRGIRFMFQVPLVTKGEATHGSNQEPEEENALKTSGAAPQHKSMDLYGTGIDALQRLETVKRLGILSIGSLRRAGVTALASVDEAVNLFSGGTLPLENVWVRAFFPRVRAISAEAAKESLYEAYNGILQVVIERAADVRQKLTEKPQQELGQILSRRAMASVLYVVNAKNLGVLDRENVRIEPIREAAIASHPIALNGPIPLEAIEEIIVPQHLKEIAAQVFPPILVTPVGATKITLSIWRWLDSGSGNSLAAQSSRTVELDVPDYAAAIVGRAIAADSPFLLHLQRLMTPDDVAAPDRSIVFSKRSA
jgi:hypothetical protein